ncbi:MAG: hypothetical protein ACK55Z_11495, partial [bacterium]
TQNLNTIPQKIKFPDYLITRRNLPEWTSDSEENTLEYDIGHYHKLSSLSVTDEDKKIKKSE